MKGHSAMDSSNARSPHHIMWRGRAPDASSKKKGRFALTKFRKLILEREHLFSSQLNIVETRDQTLSSMGMGGKSSGGCQNDNLINGLVDQTRPEVCIPPSDSLRTTQTLSGIQSGGRVLQIQGNAFWDSSLTNIFLVSDESNPSGDEKDIGFANNQLLGRYSPIGSGLFNPETTNNSFDGNIRTVQSDNLAQEMLAGTQTRESALRLDLEFNNNITIYSNRSKINVFGFAQEVSKDNFEQPHDSSQISGRDNLNFKVSQSAVQKCIHLSDDPVISTNMRSERTWMVRNDEIADVCTVRDVLMDQQDIRKQETFFDMEHSLRDSGYGYNYRVEE
ncbi:MAG: hypothetical protein EZS28_043548 [Streblomastix strix]|uniref:Uncharacterized protein n=1 Tax=Streblomastix strix TaxID=222440 RepID=A0A5J4TQY4_9EUKA|nr:MAG: hypothetical protein EZS28_043548 [Streblomastix strix]